MQTNCTVLAKIVINKKLNTYRILFSFDKHNKITVRNAVLVTGDVCSITYDKASIEITKQINNAMQTLRCANVAIVE
jgi:hypothetical protein